MRTMSNVDLSSRRRLRYVTSHYPQIQGLRLLPFGLWLLCMTGYEAYFKPNGFVPGQQSNWSITLLYFGGPILVLVLYGFIGAFYKSTFGHVQSRSDVRTVGLGGCLSGIGAVFVLWFSSSLGLLQNVGTLGTALAMLLLIGWSRSGWYRKDYACMLVLVLGTLLFPLVQQQPPSTTFRITAMLIFSVLIIFGGLFDHLLLVRTFKPVPEE